MDKELKTFISPEDYLEIERQAEYKSEYYNGEMFAFAGAGFNHNIIAVNITTFLNNQLRSKSCIVFNSDMRLFVEAFNLYTYPDVMIVCGKVNFLDDNKDNVLNPLMIIEILSKSTESYDRGKKFEFYRSIPSLKEYVLVSSDRPLVEIFTKNEKNLWVLSDEKNLENLVKISSIGLDVPLKEIYFKVDFIEKD